MYTSRKIAKASHRSLFADLIAFRHSVAPNQGLQPTDQPPPLPHDDSHNHGTIPEEPSPSILSPDPSEPPPFANPISWGSVAPIPLADYFSTSEPENSSE
jgi:hypothetical protein